MENLLNTSTSIVMPTTPRGSFQYTIDKSQSSASSPSDGCYPHKSVENLKREESGGIPIPDSRRDTATHGIPMATNSPPTGRYSSNNTFLYGSPGTSPVQTGGIGYLDVYGSSSGGGGSGGVGGSSVGLGTGSGRNSRAVSPSPLSSSVSGSGVGGGEYRLGNAKIFFYIFDVTLSLCLFLSQNSRNIFCFSSKLRYVFK